MGLTCNTMSSKYKFLITLTAIVKGYALVSKNGILAEHRLQQHNTQLYQQDKKSMNSQKSHCHYFNGEKEMEQLSQMISIKHTRR